MDTTYTYMKVLIDTLEKKKDVLKQIYNVTQQQATLLQKNNFEEEPFQKIISLKADYLEKLEKLDKGFEQIYKRVELILKHNKDMYKTEVITSQQLIREIMDLSVSIQALEEQNKQKFSICIKEKQNKIRTFKVGSRVATNYYKNMPNIHQQGQSYFLDKKH